MKVYQPSTQLQQQLEKAFQRNPLTSEQQQRIEQLGEKVHHMARYIASVVPECSIQTRIINKLEEINLLAADAIRKHEA